MNYVIYRRVSTKHQAKDGSLGTEAQQDKITAYIKSVGGTIQSDYEEIESAATKEHVSVDQKVSISSLLSKRPLLLKAIRECEKTGAILIVWESTRLSRYSLFVDFIISSKITFVCASSPHDSPDMIKIKTIFGEAEAKRISMNTTNALAVRKKQIAENGFFISKAGNRVTKLGNNNFKRGREKKAIDPAITRLSNYALSLRSNNLTLEAIAQKLNKEKHTTPTGLEFSKATVHRLIRMAS